MFMRCAAFENPLRRADEQGLAVVAQVGNHVDHAVVGAVELRPRANAEADQRVIVVGERRQRQQCKGEQERFHAFIVSACVLH
jgi:hypothetical protein